MLVGQEKNFKYLSNSIVNNDFVHAYLFAGPEHVGKTYLAKKFAQLFLCDRGLGKQCFECKNCKQIEAGTHPDFLLNDKDQPVNVEEIRELNHFLELKPYQSKIKVLIITHIERLSTSAANAFLKTLEEPAQNTIIILTTENMDNILPTIVSRTRILRMGFEKEENIKKFLMDTEGIDEKKANDIVKMSCGRVGLALSLSRDQEAVNNIREFLRKFDETIRSKSVVRRLKLAEELDGADKPLNDEFDVIESYYYQKINKKENENLLILTQILDKIAQSRIFIKNNVNKRLILESILLTGAKS
ncbi:MAG: DNA polymerase III subunit [Patescibacteria group bacterium]|jgi:DNA polymerase-3 subunit delta'|nr:DNA polymerase III subunit [Patescibacteria group bacterium]